MGRTDVQYLESLRTYWKHHRAFPSMQKLCDVVGLQSTASVFALVGRLVDAGYLSRLEGRVAPTCKFFERPVLGRVRAGLPQQADQDEFQALNIDDYLVPEPNRTFMASVRGDSMRDAGLLDGDHVVVQRNCPTAAGDIVVASVDGELTVKYLRQDPQGRFYLQAANSAYPDIFPRGVLEVLGVVVGQFRQYRR